MDASVFFMPGTGKAMACFRFNGIGIFVLSQQQNSPVDGAGLTISQDHILWEGDYIEVVAAHGNVSPLDVRLSNFNMHKID